MINKESQHKVVHKPETDTRVLARQLAYELPNDSEKKLNYFYSGRPHGND